MRLRPPPTWLPLGSLDPFPAVRFPPALFDPFPPMPFAAASFVSFPPLPFPRALLDPLLNEAFAPQPHKIPRQIKIGVAPRICMVQHRCKRRTGHLRIKPLVYAGIAGLAACQGVPHPDVRITSMGVQAAQPCSFGVQSVTRLRPPRLEAYSASSVDLNKASQLCPASGKSAAPTEQVTLIDPSSV